MAELNLNLSHVYAANAGLMLTCLLINLYRNQYPDALLVVFLGLLNLWLANLSAR